MGLDLDLDLILIWVDLLWILVHHSSQSSHSSLGAPVQRGSCTEALAQRLLHRRSSEAHVQRGSCTEAHVHSLLYRQAAAQRLRHRGSDVEAPIYREREREIVRLPLYDKRWKQRACLPIKFDKE